MNATDLNLNKADANKQSPEVVHYIPTIGMKRFITAVIAAFILGLAIGVFIPSPLDNQESVELLINNVTIRFEVTKRIFYDWLISYLSEEETCKQHPEGFEDTTTESIESSDVRKDSENMQTINEKVVIVKDNIVYKAPEKLPSEILKLLGQAFQDSRRTAKEVSQNIAKDINSLKFEEYDERNLCDVNKGILHEEFNVTVHEIGDFLNLPDDLVKVIVRSANFNDQKQSSVELKTFKGKDGFLYFGKFAVARTKGNRVAFAYSLHGIKFKLAPLIAQPKTLNESFISFTENAMKNGLPDAKEVTEKITEKASISKEAIKGFVNHYLHETYEHFKENCKGQLDMLEGIEKEESRKEEASKENSEEKAKKE